MRRFHSYGPVDCEKHFCVQREELVQKCLHYLAGDSEKEGHYFTIWGARQTGKTWIMRQVREKIRQEHGNKFLIADFSMQSIIMKDHDPSGIFLRNMPIFFKEEFDIDIAPPLNWDEWTNLFSKAANLFDRPIILFIDEFDSLPREIIDILVSLFRNIYLKRKNYLLHGLALIGVRAVLGLESERGSPFNIQRSLHVPNLTPDEVTEMFGQYRQESGQNIEAAVTDKIYEVTRGQPGLVSWFGELLTETFNPGKDRTLCMKDWEKTYRRACTTEWNNTVLNLIKKAKGEYQTHVSELFGRSDIPFTIWADWCNYLYLNGIIDYENSTDAIGRETQICCFSSPFIQHVIYESFTYELIGDRTPILALDPSDDLSDVFDTPLLNIPGLIRRYQDYLKRLKAKGLNLWKDQPRRKDMRFTEAVGHFHLYSWLREAVGQYCAVSPEFPAGNGKVDLHIRCDGKEGIIEVKSFTDSRQIGKAAKQAAEYASAIGLNSVTLVLFVYSEDESILQKLSGEKIVGNIHVTISAIGWN